MFNKLGIPISWNLPTGLEISQSYMETKVTSITPFTYIKLTFHFLVSSKTTFDKNRQIRSLMPNLIHSLDATSLALLYEKFSYSFVNPQFFSVHDCFGTTADKIFWLKTLLASIYTDIYINDQYLIKLDEHLLYLIKQNTNSHIEMINNNNETLRRVILSNGDNYNIHDINGVLNNVEMNENLIKKIDQQFIIL